ncbi:MAG: HAD-IIIA family hydrolase [Thermotogota bacterium]|nr:HAD-IIIA family hydrolase [Thermotogota bacterium]
MKKIIEFPTAQKLIKQLKASGKTVGICHGAFDLVHPGHINHFESASKMCDLLMVSLTSDYYVKRRKGENRPIYSQEERAYMIASLEYVDYVTISDFETGKETIRYLKPNYYIKGPDYKNKSTKGILSERQAIKSVDGQMLYTNDEKYSTSKLIDKIKLINRDSLLLILDRDGTLIEEKNYLGKNENYLEEIKSKREVIDIIHYLSKFFSMTNIVFTNQSGVARGYFNEKIVQKINNTINTELEKEGIEINAWKYAPCVDKAYAEKKGIENFNPKYIKDKTKRKPSPRLVYESLSEINKNLENYNKVLVLGDKEDDEKLSRNLKALFIDVSEKTYEEIKKEIDNSLKLK